MPDHESNQRVSFEVEIPEGFPAQGVILVDQVKSLDWREREAEFMGRLPEETVEEVLQKLGVLLG
jgi:mRNA interferase MazF